MATKANTKTASSAARKKTGGKAAAPQPQGRPIRREVGAAVCAFLALLCVIGYFDVDAVFVTVFCKFIKSLIGYGYYIFPPALAIAAWALAVHRGRPVAGRTVCALLLPVVFGALAHVLFCRESIDTGTAKLFLSQLYDSGREMLSGGVVSGALAMGLKKLFSVYGTVPLLLLVFLALGMVALRVSPARLAEKMRERPRLEYEPEPEPEPLPEPAPVRRSGGAHIAAPQRRQRRAIDIPLDETEEDEEEYVENKVGFFNANPRVKTPDQVLERHLAEEAAAADIPAGEEEDSWEEAFKEVPVAPPPVMEPVVPVFEPVPVVRREAQPDIHTEEILSDMFPQDKKSSRKKGVDPEELYTQTADIARTVAESEQAGPPAYQYPPLSLLRQGSGAAVDGREEMLLNRERLQMTLKSFGVNAAISDITRGPTVTRYDLELEAGVKLAKLTNLAGDVALSLGVSGVRIAPIPDKISTVGVEVPNKIVSTVYLRDIIGSDTFRAAASKLTFAIGEDIGGSSVCGNIAKLPHMLIAGTTGSGKSVCMNSLILSLLYKATPEEVRLIMIDPKMVELGIYNGIPHLYIPVVTDPKKAAGALQWSVVEMLKRYRLFSEVGVRDLAAYNKIRKKDGEAIVPQLVVVIDELADLMMVAGKEVEESICRVAQMGRAAGVHLVIATQRPSADVITGLMKANIPSRIAFAVSSAMESRIILDAQGAEKLVGSGDMLYAPIGGGKPRRIQGAFVTDEEREEVVNFIKANSEAQYSDEIMRAVDENAAAADKPEKGSKAESVSESAEPGASYDELLPQAVEVIFETKQASVSMLQRRLKLGYSRAARIVDQMEEIGVVGPFEGSKPRQILVTKEQWQAMQSQSGVAPAESEIPDSAVVDDFTLDNPDDWEDGE